VTAAAVLFSTFAPVKSAEADQSFITPDGGLYDQRDLPAALPNKSFICRTKTEVAKVEVNPARGLLTLNQQRNPLITVLMEENRSGDWEMVSGPEDHEVVMKRTTGQWIYYHGFTEYDCQQTK
jgi:hypothetical protein